MTRGRFSGEDKNDKQEAGTPPLYPSLLEDDPFAANFPTTNSDANAPTGGRYYYVVQLNII